MNGKGNKSHLWMCRFIYFEGILCQLNISELHKPASSCSERPNSCCYKMVPMTDFSTFQAQLPGNSNTHVFIYFIY